jgi:AcrR family transcriptional regulator
MPAPLTGSALEAKRDRILDAARRVCVRSDLDSAKMADIAAEARVSKGTLYRFFQSKEDLLLEMVAHNHADFVSSLSSALAAARPDDQLDRFVDLVIDIVPMTIEQNRLTFQALGFAARTEASQQRLEESTSANYLERHELLATAVKLGKEAGALRADLDVDAAVGGLLAVCDGLLWRCTFEPAMRTPERLRAVFSEVIGCWRALS